MSGLQRTAGLAACHQTPYDSFKEHGYLGIETEALKMMTLIGLNMVECIARTAPTKTKRLR